MEALAALDLETTGPEAQRDAVIELGASKFNGDQMAGESSAPVDPGGRVDDMRRVVTVGVSRVGCAPLLAAAP
ncbi:MAG TPA: hypothetical protein VF591_13635 [Pyrinomonadaceae bacterium]|jgi:DNA polymerase III epsilon subunit-like protein